MYQYYSMGAWGKHDERPSIMSQLLQVHMHMHVFAVAVLAIGLVLHVSGTECVGSGGQTAGARPWSEA